MNVFYSKKFDKMFLKCPQEIRDKFIERLGLFKENKYDSTLNNHTLSGKLKGSRSINVSGDYRVIFKEKPDGILLTTIGTHSQLYK